MITPASYAKPDTLGAGAFPRAPLQVSYGTPIPDLLRPQVRWNGQVQDIPPGYKIPSCWLDLTGVSGGSTGAVLPVVSFNTATGNLTITSGTEVTSTSLASLATDIKVTGTSYSNITGLLTITRSDNTSFTADLSDLKNGVIPPYVSAGNLPLVAGTDKIVSATELVGLVTALATVDVRDAFGIHLYSALP